MSDVLNGKSEVSTSVVKWIEGLSNRVSIIMRRFIVQKNFAACMAVIFIIFFPYSAGSINIIVCMIVCFVCCCLIL